MKINETLNYWNKEIMEVVTDEELKDIDLAIKYHDHGDEFLYIRTYSKEQYVYGYWFDRPGLSEFDITKNNGESDSSHIRRPILYKKPDVRSEMSNEVYWATRSDCIGIMDHTMCGPVIAGESAIRRLYNSLDEVKRIITKHPDTMYHLENYKKDFVQFIICNFPESTDKYIKDLDEIKWTSRVNGFDGIAGKRNADNDIYGDGIREILYRGRSFDINKVTYNVSHRDEFGSNTYHLNTNQFA